MPKPTETPEQIRQREYRERTKNASTDRLIPYELYQLRLAINALSDNTGKWLAAVALAASTPEDNSAEVQKQIDKHAAEVRTTREKLQSSVNRNQPKGE